MQKKLTALKTALFSKKSSRKNFILTIVALVEIIMIMVVSTVAWVETTSSLEIRGTGNIDTVTYTTAKIGSGGEYTDKGIDLSGYFRSAGNVHLAKASSADGSDIYFPVIGKTSSNTQTYRKGNVNDKNVNYICFAFDLNAATSGCNFYFEQVPTIKVGDTTVTNNDVRIAITALGKTTIYSNNENKTETVVSAVDGTESATAVESFAKHTDSGDNTELFEVKSGATERIIISLWLQEPENPSIYDGKTVTVENFELVSGTVKVSFADCTTGFNGSVSASDPTEANAWHWVDNDNPQLLIYDGENSYLMSKDDDFSTNYTWLGRVPQAVVSDSSKTLYFCRCEKGTKSISALSDSSVYNYWEAKVSDAISENSVKYTAYGATKSGGKVGYGTWGDVIEIQLYTEDTTVLPVPVKSVTATAVTLTNTNNSNIVCQMNYHEKIWRGFVPYEGNTGSFKFSFTSSNKKYEITADNRDTAETISKFVVTSAKTGYWYPPAIVTVHTNNEDYGAVSVSGGAENATSVKVTQGAKVNLLATPKEGRDLVNWYSDEEYKTKVESVDAQATAVYAPNKGETAHYYAKFEIQTFKVEAYAYTDGSNSTVGGTVKVSTASSSGDTGESSNLTVDYDTSVTYTATKASGYDFEGWYDKATGGTKVYSSTEIKQTIKSKENAILYARFKKQGTTVYLKPKNADWLKNNERYAAYMWDNSGNVWYDLTGPDEYGCYKFTYTDSKTNIIFCRMDGNNPNNKWNDQNSSSPVWNQTKNLVVDKTNNCFVVGNKINSGDDNGKYDGKWTSYPPTDQSVDDKVIITFIDATPEKWIYGDTVVMRLIDNSNGQSYEMTEVNKTTWTVEVPASVKNIKFNRDNGNTQTWNFWSAGDRGSSTTYYATKNSQGNW